MLSGKARLRAGSLIFVAAQVEHQFHDIEEELTVLVLFAPAERDRPCASIPPVPGAI